MKRMLIIMLCFAILFGITACGSGGGEAQSGNESAAEEPEAPAIKITGTDYESGDLKVLVPDGWEVLESYGDWTAGEVKLCETASLSSDGSYGRVYVDIQDSDYSDYTNAYNEDSQKGEAEEYDDENCVPAEYALGDNTYTGFRTYTYVGDSAEDWMYYAYDGNGNAVEIRAYIDAEYASEQNRAAIQAILESLAIGGALSK